MAKGKLQSAKSRISKLIAENKSLALAKSAVKRAASKENAQLLAIGGVAAGAGVIGGVKLQEYLNNSDLPDMAKAVGGIPTGTLIGAAVALYGAFKMRGQAQAALAGAGGGMAGGAYITGGPA